MAKIKGDSILKNVRGMLGKQIVLKERLGKPYVCSAPVYDEERFVSEAEQANRDRFGRTTAFAKAAMLDPELKSAYAALTNKPGHTAFTTAKSDASRPPEIVSLITAGYTGIAGSVIIVQATDNVKVKSVRVTIYDAANEAVESGDAVDHGDGFNWMFAATINNPEPGGCTIEAKALDLAGNETIKQSSF